MENLQWVIKPFKEFREASIVRRIEIIGAICTVAGVLYVAYVWIEGRVSITIQNQAKVVNILSIAVLLLFVGASLLWIDRQKLKRKHFPPFLEVGGVSVNSLAQHWNARSGEKEMHSQKKVVHLNKYIVNVKIGEFTKRWANGEYCHIFKGRCDKKKGSLDKIKFPLYGDSCSDKELVKTQIHYYRANDDNNYEEKELSLILNDKQLRKDICMTLQPTLDYPNKFDLKLEYPWERAFKFGRDFYFIDTFDFGAVEEIHIEIEFMTLPKNVDLYFLKTGSWISGEPPCVKHSRENNKYLYTIPEPDPKAYYLVVYETHPQNTEHN